MLLYQRHPERMKGDSYAGWIDYIQPPLAALCVALLPLTLWPAGRMLAALVLCLILAAQLPMALRMAWRLRQPRMLAFVPLGAVRAFFRSLGMVQGVLRVARDAVRGEASARASVEAPVS
jgi:hypothetical protein